MSGRGGCEEEEEGRDLYPAKVQECLRSSVKCGEMRGSGFRL